jgi:AraC-like DNA-binding protein
MSVSARALWYIESHLGGDLSLELIARDVGVSPYHLSRAFGTATGCGLAHYVRARRLSEAAKALLNGAPDILSVSLDSGYGSHEAFTRAFRQHFGLTPERARAQRPTTILDLLEPNQNANYNQYLHRARSHCPARRHADFRTKPRLYTSKHGWNPISMGAIPDPLRPHPNST